MARDKKNKKISLIVALSMIMFAHNNCGGGFKSASTLTEDGSNSGDPVIDPVTPPVVVVPPPTTPAPTPPPVVAPEPPPVTLPLLEIGKAQYASNCAGCHGALETSTKHNINLARLDSGLNSIPQMSFLKDANLNKEALILALTKDIAQPTSKPKFACETPTRRGIASESSRRLTKFELKQTINDIFGADVLNQLDTKLGLYKEEVFKETVSEFDPNVDQNLAFALFDIAQETARLSLTTYENTQRLLPTCMLSAQNTISLADQSCNVSFLNSLGLKLLRRPLTADQISEYDKLLKANESFIRYNRDRIELVIASMMLTPEFTHILSFIESGSGEKGRVDNYTLASRMSYQLTGSMPDAELFTSAQSGQILNIERRKLQANRLINKSSGRQQVRNLFRHILELDRSFDLDSEYGDHINVSSNNLLNDLRKEALDFVEHIVFVEKGNLESLLTSTKAFPPSTNSAKLFNLSEQSQGVNDPKTVNSDHAGVYMRPIVLASSGMRTAPIIRGLKYTTKVLCNYIPDPDPSLIEEGEEKEEELDLLASTSREISEHMTASINCQSCHQHINPPGFFFEGFGPFGDNRTSESVFDSNKNFIRNLPIDTTVDNFKIDNVNRSIASSNAFNKAIADSDQGQSCFVENVFKYSKLREVFQDDSCHMADIEEVTRDKKSIIDILIQNAISEDQLWEKIN